MSGDSVPVTVHILDKEYRVGCPDQERDSLFEAAQFLNDKMREVRDKGKVIGADRIAVMVALNIVHELLQYRGDQQPDTQVMGARLRALHSKIDSALHDGRQMEL